MANHKAELKKRVPWENDKRNRKNNTEKKMLCELIIELGYTLSLFSPVIAGFAPLEFSMNENSRAQDLNIWPYS